MINDTVGRKLAENQNDRQTTRVMTLSQSTKIINNYNFNEKSSKPFFSLLTYFIPTQGLKTKSPHNNEHNMTYNNTQL